jgi:hypothetical protein
MIRAVVSHRSFRLRDTETAIPNCEPPFSTNSHTQETVTPLSRERSFVNHGLTLTPLTTGVGAHSAIGGPRVQEESE